VGLAASGEEWARSFLQSSNQQGLLLLTIAVAPAMLAATMAIVYVQRRWIDRRSFASMGFVRLDARRVGWIGVGLVAGAAPIAAVVGQLFLTGNVAIERSGLTWISALICGGLVLMAFYEEFLFRGYLYRNFLDEGRPVAGLIVTSIAFWLLHSFNPHVWTSPWASLNLMGAGVVLALAYQLSDELWFPTAMHFGWNAAQGLLFGLPISGIRVAGVWEVTNKIHAPEWMTGGEFGLESSALVTFLEVAIAAFLGMLVFRVQRRKSSPSGDDSAEPIWAELV
jgi:hypothetical protein